MPAFRNVCDSSLLYDENEIMSENELYSDESDSYSYDSENDYDNNKLSLPIKNQALSSVIRKNKMLEEQKIKTEKERILKEKEQQDVEKYIKTVTPLLSWIKQEINVNDSDDSDDEKIPAPSQKATNYDNNFPNLSEINIKNQKKLENIYQKNKDNNLWENTTQHIKKNEKKIVNEIKKTRMCSFGIDCRRRNCTFAHKTSELSIRECKNGSNCMFIKKTNNNIYYNNPNKNGKCEYIHANESRENYLKRNNITDPISKKEEQIKEKEINEELKKFLSINESSLPIEINDSLKTLHSNKSIFFKGQYFYGKLEVFNKPVSPPQKHQNNKFNHYTYKYIDKPTKVFTNTPKKIKPIKFIDDPEKEFIRERNKKSDEIRSIKRYIELNSNTIERIYNNRTFNDDKRLNKLLDENKKNKEQLLILEEEFQNIKIVKRKQIEVEEIQTLPLIEEKIDIPVSINKKPIFVIYVPPKIVIPEITVFQTNSEEQISVKEEIIIKPETDVIVSVKEEIIIKPETDLIVSVKEEIIIKPEAEIIASVKEEIIIKPEAEIIASVKEEIIIKPEAEIIASVKKEIIIKPEARLNIPLSFAERVKINKEKIIEKPIENKKQPIVSKPKISNLKTQLCKSYYLKNPCFHGKTCRYAHNLDELVVTNCGYDNCKLVKYNNGSYTNTGSKICSYKHKGETKDNYIKRNKN